ncbi:MAG: protein kinase, partial [Thermodesulfobacteriota bacterium]
MTQKIGKYEILGKIGTGSMGAVYKAVDPGIQRKVAIKTIRNELISSKSGEDMLKRFQHEAQAIGQLHHPHIVAVFEYGEDQGETFIAMTYAEGRDLKDYFDKQEKFSLETILTIMEQLVDALAFSHKHNIFHRDIKPANIIVQNNGDIMVTDFGIARLETSELTQAGTVMGTPSYMSPEQLIGQRVDGRTDIFSAGVVFYQFLTGEKPFSGSTVASIMHKIINLEPVPPSHLDITIPAFLDEIVLKSLAKSREDRYQKADDFKRDIQAARFRMGHGGSQADESTIARTAAGSQAFSGAPAPDEQTVVAPQSESAAKSAPVDDATVALAPDEAPPGGDSDATIALSSFSGAPSEGDEANMLRQEKTTEPPAAVVEQETPGKIQEAGIPVEKSQSPKKGLLTAAGVAALLLAGGLVFFLTGGDEGRMIATPPAPQPVDDVKKGAASPPVPEPVAEVKKVVATLPAQQPADEVEKTVAPSVPQAVSHPPQA